MTVWTSEELDRIGSAEELRIASVRPDGTLRKPVIIWVVRCGDELYVRCVSGRSGKWFRHALESHEGHIQAGGAEKDVRFIEETDAGINEQIDAAYRSKYHHYVARIVDSIVRPDARAATIRLAPLSVGN